MATDIAGDAPGSPSPPPQNNTTIPMKTKPPKIPTIAEPNVSDIVFGSLLIKPWYPSFYPEEIVGRPVDRLHVCQWCFKYTKELVKFLGHLKACPLSTTPPPGVLVYSKPPLSLYEVDGSAHKLFAQNLSLFAKIFLDTKSVFYDVTTFLYYLLVLDDPSPSIPNTRLHPEDGVVTDTSKSQVVGFFSKEKMSWDNNNLACICVFPPWQRQGWGQVLMAASYELGRREGRMGGPEKPLSDLGHQAYHTYWSSTLAHAILSLPLSRKKSKNTPITIATLRDETYIAADDILATLKRMDVLEQRRRTSKKGATAEGVEVVVNKGRVRAWVERRGARLGRVVDEERFVRVVEGVEGKEINEEEDEDEDGEMED